ncbi:MAG: N-acetylmuramoyl-L-alanine amidase [Magnetococcales bacterium]|nr:N-acetylmuramoyl-L-alanine amidase [Magnetococcales bacterium]
MIAYIGKLVLWMLLFWPHQGHSSEINLKDTIIAVDIGHTSQHVGAMSAHGRGEFQFNLEVGQQVNKELVRRGFAHTVPIINPKNLLSRTQIAKKNKADLFLSIHHDSVQSYYLNEWTYHGQKLHYCDLFQGFSLLVSTRNSEFHKSLLLATLLGQKLKQLGFVPTQHHALDVPGERHAMFHANLGIYRYDNLVVLRTADMPAVLVEVGVIVNRQEEIRLRQEETQSKVARSLADAIQEYTGIIASRNHFQPSRRTP